MMIDVGAPSEVRETNDGSSCWKSRFLDTQALTFDSVKHILPVVGCAARWSERLRSSKGRLVEMQKLRTHARLIGSAKPQTV